MQLRRTLTAALLSASLVAAVPAVADAHRGRGADRCAQQSLARGKAPSRIATRLSRAERALSRAGDAVDDGNATTAATTLKSVRTNLASAVKSAKRRAGTDTGPASYYAVASTQHHIVDGVASLYDGADDTTVAGLTQTLNAAIDGRDELVASIAALDASAKANYADVASAINGDVTEEIASIDESLQDDTLTDQAKADLTAARAKLVATQAAVQPLAASSSNTANSRHGSRGSRNGSGSSSSSEVPAT
jgi:hypothetical protein